MFKQLSYGIFIVIPLCALIIVSLLVVFVFRLSALHPNEDMYFAYSLSFGHEDGDYFWHDINDTITRVHSADIVILGNSHILHGIHAERLSDSFRKHNLRFYNLGFGNNEGIRFPSQVLRKYNIRPKAVIVNVDNATFSRELSDYSQAVVSRNVYTGYARVYSHYMLFAIEQVIREIWFGAARLVNIPVNCDIDTISFRSYTHGTWKFFTHDNFVWVDKVFMNLKPIAAAIVDTPIGTKEFEAAKLFVDEMNNRGTKVIFTSVPYDNMSNIRYKEMSAALGVPYIDIPSDSLTTFDKAHLDPESAKIFTQRFAVPLEEHLQALGVLKDAKVKPDR